ncbi:MAG: ComF family protein [bacterium]
MNSKKIKKDLLKIHNFLLDTIFPISCICCKKEGNWICQKCFASIKIKEEHVCPVCEKVLTHAGRTCVNCKNFSEKNFLSGLLPACSYNQSIVSKAVHLFKYRFIKDLSVTLANLMTRAAQKTEFPIPDLIIPVPLHQKRLRWRGFNQSQLLARKFANNLLPNIKLKLSTKILLRNRNTSPQMNIEDWVGRQQNISEAFSVSPTADIKNKTVLLVDDIATTGSTIFECAKTLKLAGAKEVFAIVIARQENKK